ncbi:MAG: dihydrolipoyl dehydrogenase [bacterium]
MIPKLVCDVMVLGSGPGGYIAAIRAAQLGYQVAIIEDLYIGGTCLNVGCIPSKALLDDTKLWTQLDHLADRGITIGNKSIDLSRLQARRQKVVDQLVGGVKQLLEGNNISIVNGRGVFQGAGQIRADNAATGEVKVVEFDHAIIATGSVPATIPGFAFDGVDVVSSTEAMVWETAPARLLVVGAGAIGLEMGSIWNRLGSKVVMVEFLERIAATMDEEISKRSLPIFKAQGLDIRTGIKALGFVKNSDGSLTVELEAVEGGAKSTITVDKILVAVGRKPHSANIGLDRIGVEVTERGFIKVDSHLRTASRVVYAIGDVIGGIMYAHKAMEEGVIAAENIAGHKLTMDHVIPGAIFTSPEIAHVGLTEQELKESGREYKKGTFKFAVQGKAIALGETDGFCKLLADKATDEILGCHIVGPHASDLIAEAAVAMELGATLEDLQHTIHTHPTLAEAVHEAALSADNRSLHQLNRTPAVVR